MASLCYAKTTIQLVVRQPLVDLLSRGLVVCEAKAMTLQHYNNRGFSGKRGRFVNNPRGSIMMRNYYITIYFINLRYSKTISEN